MWNFEFNSQLGFYMQDFLIQKQDLGFNIKNYYYYFHEFDDMLCSVGNPEYITPKIIDAWDNLKADRSTRTRIARHNNIRTLCIYIRDRDSNTFVPDTCCLKNRCTFVPYVFSRDEIHRIITEADNLPFRRNAKLRHLIIPAAIRMLYGCGYREGELLNMRLQDVDLDTGVTTVTGKGGKERYVVMAPGLLAYMREYIHILTDEIDTEWLFPRTQSFKSGHYSRNALYTNFREITLKCGIHHGGRSLGPRVHDLRHTFAVHSLETQLRMGYKPMEIIPRLAAYLGHAHYKDTMYYLHLTEETFPDLISEFEECFSALLPKGVVVHEED